MSLEKEYAAATGNCASPTMTQLIASAGSKLASGGVEDDTSSQVASSSARAPARPTPPAARKQTAVPVAPAPRP